MIVPDALEMGIWGDDSGVGKGSHNDRLCH
jgi:hypothetical protein